MFESCLYFNTTALARQLERVWSAAFAPFGLTPAQAFLLRTILTHPGLAAYEIADTQAIARPTATRLIDGLAAKGLVERRSSDDDGRAQSVHPTDAAIPLHEPLNRASGEVTRRLQRILGADRFHETVENVRAVRFSLD